MIANAAEFTHDFKYGQGATRWTFHEAGITPHRKIAVVHRSKWGQMVRNLETFVAQGTTQAE